MTLKYKSKHFLGFWMLYFIWCGIVSAQDRLRLVSAERLEGTVENGIPVKRLLGQVRLVQGEAFLECEEALWWEESQRAQLMNRVVIYDAKRTLRADEVDYHGSLKMEKATGHVVLESGTKRILADELVYWQESRLASAKGHVQVEDLKEHLLLTGKELFFDQTRDYGFLEGDPQLVRFDTTSAQKHWYGKGKKMEFWREPGRVLMTDSVRIEQDETLVCSEIAEYLPQDSLLILRKFPVIYQKNREMRADSMAIFLEGTQFRGGHLFGSAKVISEKDSTRDELHGREIRIQARGDTLEEVLVENQAKSIFTILDESNVPQGVNTVTGDRIKIVFEGDEIKTVEVNSHPGVCVGQYVPWNDRTSHSMYH